MAGGYGFETLLGSGVKLETLRIQIVANLVEMKWVLVSEQQAEVLFRGPSLSKQGGFDAVIAPVRFPRNQSGSHLIVTIVDA